MFKKSAIAGIALASAFAATAASAHGTHYGTSHTTYTTPSYSSSTYTAPTVNLGPIEYVQPNSTVQYAPTTTYTAPTYTAPTYTTPTYSTPTYIQPATTTTYTYTQPTYTTPTYTTPAYVAPYDGTSQIRSRIQRQRSRIEAAEARGDLRRGEERRLRSGLQDIRQSFRAYRNNDGVINSWEQRELNAALDRNSRRIARLANNHRTARPAYSPYNPYPVY